MRILGLHREYLPTLVEQAISQSYKTRAHLDGVSVFSEVGESTAWEPAPLTFGVIAGTGLTAAAMPRHSRLEASCFFRRSGHSRPGRELFLGRNRQKRNRPSAGLQGRGMRGTRRLRRGRRLGKKDLRRSRRRISWDNFEGLALVYRQL